MRALIVGAGLMGRHHAEAAAKAGAMVVAIVDSNKTAAASLARRFRGAVTEDDFQRALETLEADVVHICTPAETHETLAHQAANAGLHALIEKPMAARSVDTRRMLDDYARARRLACPTHQYAFQRSVRSAVAALSSLGQARQVAFDICSAGGEHGAIDLDRLVADILPHPLAIVQKLMPGADVGQLDWSCLRTAPGEWLISAPCEGAAISISLSMNGRPTRFLTRIIADRGSLELDHFHDYHVELSGAVSRARKVALPFIRSALALGAATKNIIGRAARSEFAYPGLRTLVAEFYAAARDPKNGAPPITPEEAIAVAVARDRLIELAADG